MQTDRLKLDVLDVKYRSASEAEINQIIDLLKNVALPYSDLTDSKVTFIVATNTNQELIGAIGVEIYGADGLLRSFAVNKRYKNIGIGHQLLSHMLAKCANEGLSHLHLLTNTAKDFFLKRGFYILDRISAPESIQSTQEFSLLCPSSAIYMTKQL
ncbi:MAG TPA: arsenic resistance N-acetyltransferase ArsN2 [Saprospiraceae bacterium]|nr:arsenic resistance N-acetyltransferase ArsN2 [Saprospiraceae bacterium]